MRKTISVSTVLHPFRCVRDEGSSKREVWRSGTAGAEAERDINWVDDQLSGGSALVGSEKIVQRTAN